MINFKLKISHKSDYVFILELKHLQQRWRILKAQLRRQFQNTLHFLHEPHFYIPYTSLQSILHPTISFGRVWYICDKYDMNISNLNIF